MPVAHPVVASWLAPVVQTGKLAPRPESIRLGTVTVPVKVGVSFAVSTGVVVPVATEIRLLADVTEVTVPFPVPQVGHVILGVVPPEETMGPVAVTAVTGAVTREASGIVAEVILAPLSTGAEEKVLIPAMVWLVVKSTKFWVPDPVPPLEIGITPVTVMLGVVPPEEAMLPEPVTAVTHVVQVMLGVVPPDDAIGPVAVTAVTEPPPPPPFGM